MKPMVWILVLVLLVPGAMLFPTASAATVYDTIAFDASGSASDDVAPFTGGGTWGHTVGSEPNMLMLVSVGWLSDVGGGVGDCTITSLTTSGRALMLLL